MGLRRIAFAPLYRLADWVDDNPVSAVGVVVALGALAVLLVSVSLGNGTETGALALDTNTVGTLAETAIERPAYLVAVVFGLVVLLFYDG